MSSAPVSWVVCSRVGAFSEPWLWRQVMAFRRLRPEVVTGAYENPEVFPFGGIPVHLFPAAGRPHRGVARWAARAAGLHQRNFLGLDPLQAGRLRSLVRDRRPEVALCHFGHVALRVLPAARKTGLPVVAHFHGLDLSSSLRNRWYRWSLTAALPHLAAAVVVGTHQQRLLLEHGMPEARVHLIPCGVQLADYRLRRHAGSESARFVAVSRLVAWKGIGQTLRAFAVTLQAVPCARLEVVGEGPERPALERLAGDLGITAAVTFRGSLPPAEVASLLSSSDVFLQHSLDHTDGWTEGFGISITEASASGLPVVVTRCGGIRDQVVDGETGFLVDQHDTAAMAEGMVALARDPDLRRRLGEAGRRLVEHCYDTRQQVDRLETVLLGVAR